MTPACSLTTSSGAAGGTGQGIVGSLKSQPALNVLSVYEK